MFRGERRPGQAWTAKDRTVALGLAVYEAGLCKGCGHPLDDTYTEGAERAYEVPPPHRCHACTALHKGMDGYDSAPVPQALHFGVRLKDGVRRV